MKKYLLLFISLFVITGCVVEKPKISEIILKNDKNIISEDERNYFGSYLGEVIVKNPPKKQEYRLEVTGYQEFASPIYETYPVYEARIKIEPNKTSYSFIIPKESFVDFGLGNQFPYDQCKNLILKAELCFVKNNICFGDPLDRLTYLHQRSCGE